MTIFCLRCWILVSNASLGTALSDCIFRIVRGKCPGLMGTIFHHSRPFLWDHLVLLCRTHISVLFCTEKKKQQRHHLRCSEWGLGYSICEYFLCIIRLSEGCVSDSVEHFFTHGSLWTPPILPWAVFITISLWLVLSFFNPSLWSVVHSFNPRQWSVATVPQCFSKLQSDWLG